MSATKWNEYFIKKQIKKRAEIPVEVVGKVNEAYQMIENGKVQQIEIETKSAFEKTFQPFRWALRAACAIMIAFVASLMVCAVNPVLAEQLPIINGLFAQLQDKVSFFGNFSDRAVALEDSEETGSEQNVYTKTQDGLTVTFSEIYANDRAIYLTMQMKSDEPFPDVMMNETDGRTSPVFALEFEKKYSFMDQGEPILDLIYPEGEMEDDSTYNCILRLDLTEDAKDYSEYEKQYGLLQQQALEELGITMDDINDETEQGSKNLEQYNDLVMSRQGEMQKYIKSYEIPDQFTLSLNMGKVIGMKAEPESWDSGYTSEELENMSDEEWRNVMAQQPKEYLEFPNQYENFWYEGDWDFEIPVTIDTTQTVVQEIHEVNENGIGLDSVIKTPYELAVNLQFEEGSNSDVFMVALDANGNKLPYIGESGSTDQFAIQDRDISTVDIYVLDYVQYMDELKGEARYNGNENKPVEEKWSTLLDANAKYHKTIHF